MDAIELLEKDHQKVTELFKRFNGGGGLTGMVNRMTGNVPARQRRQAADQVCRELDVHAQLEEELFYPAVRSLNDDRLNGMLSEAFNEHATVKRQVASIRNGGGMDSELQSKMNELQSCVDHHVREEENEMFPRVQLLMDAARRDELGRELQERKRERAPERRPASRAQAKRATGGRSRKTRESRTRTTAGRRSRATAAAKRSRARGRTAAAKARKRVRTTARGRARTRRAR